MKLFEIEIYKIYNVIDVDWKFHVVLTFEKILYIIIMKDLSILFASMVKVAGFRTAIIFHEGLNINDHIYAGVYLKSEPKHSSDNPPNYIELNGEEFYNCECTVFGYMIGDLPEDFIKYRKRHIFEVEDFKENT